MFLVLGLRPGELFALCWNDKEPNSLRIDNSITDGQEVETKTEGSDSFVWLPASIDAELEFWRGTCKDASPEAFIFPSARGTAISTNNFLFRVLTAERSWKKSRHPRSRSPDAAAHLFDLYRSNHQRQGCPDPSAAHEREDDAGALYQIRTG